MSDQTPSPAIPTDTIYETKSQKPKSFFSRKWKWLVAIAVVVVALAAVLVWLFFRSKPQQGQPNVKVWFDVSETITSGSETEIRLIYENQDTTDLRSITLQMVFPDGFRFVSSEPLSADGQGRTWNLPDLAANSSSNVSVKGIFSGSPMELKTLQAKLYYQLKGYSAMFSSQALAQVSLQAPDFNLRVIGPTEVINSQKVDYQISFQNISEQELNRVQIRVTYPSGFNFLNSSLSPQDKDRTVWDIGRLSSGQEQQLRITGVLAGSRDEEKQISVNLGYLDENGQFVLQNQQFATTRILAPPLNAEQKLTTPSDSQVVREGEPVSLQVNYENSGDQGLHDVQIMMLFSGEAADFSTMDIEGGALIDKKVVWKASGQPALALLQPGTKGELDLRFNVKKTLASQKIENPEVKTQVLISSAEFPDPISGNEISVRVGSSLTAKPKMSFVSGANPPQSGQETNYKVTLMISNSLNQLNDVSWTAVVNSPPFSFMQDSVSPASRANEVSYDSDNGRFEWKMASLPAFTDTQIEFNLKLTPSEADRNSTLELMQRPEVSGQDTFTGNKVQVDSIEKLITGTVGGY